MYKNSDRPFYLELGAGYRPTDGYVHQDINPGNHIEIVCDAARIDEFVDTPVDLLRATHLLEHFSYRDTVKVLKAWHNILDEHGALYIEVPNLSWQTKAHCNGELSDEEAISYIFGEQDFDGNYHYAGFTKKLLEDKLRAAGFELINVWEVTQVLCASAQKLNLIDSISTNR